MREQTETWSFDATIDTPASARAVVRSFLRDPPVLRETLDAIILCVSEAVTNAVLHAYRNSAIPGDVALEVQRYRSHVCVIVRDRGQGLRPRIDSPGLGVGLSLISQVATETEIRTPEKGGTEVSMRFDL